MSDEPPPRIDAGMLDDDLSHAPIPRIAPVQEWSGLEALRAAAEEYDNMPQTSAIKESPAFGNDLGGFEDWWALQNGDR